jgi:hypothetical protein
MTVSCSGIADFTTNLKVNTPTGTPAGTVIFGTGTGGTSLYDSTWTYGSNVVQDVLNAGFTTVQVVFGGLSNNSTNGWLTGPGGIRRLACRYATAAGWVYTNIHKSNTSAPFCGTGNSGGSAAIAYSVAYYGLDSIFSFVESTSGPPLTRVDYGCICNGNTSIGPSVSLAPLSCPSGNVNITDQCYEAGVVTLVDLAYGPTSTICSQANGSGSTANQPQFISDSIGGPAATTGFGKTAVNLVFGGQDNTSAVPQGIEWYDLIISANNGPLSPTCVEDAPSCRRFRTLRLRSLMTSQECASCIEGGSSVAKAD